jgi:hypothetical protein
MPLPVSLQRVIDDMDSQGDMIDGYINHKTGELMSVNDDQRTELEWVDNDEYDTEMEDLPEWMQEAMPRIKEVLQSDDFIPLPSSFEIHEYAIMRDFCHTVEDPKVKEELLVGINGRGAFRMFKELIFRHDIRNDWFAYKNEALKQIAMDFLEEHDIAYEDDCRSNPNG